MVRAIEAVGARTIGSLVGLGQYGRFMARIIATVFSPPVKWRQFIQRVDFIGAKSLWLIVLIGAFTGAVLALQVYYTLIKFGAESRVGTVVALSMIRELGPVICALMVTGRAGSSLAAELGIMKNTEQFDALQIMGLDPFRYYMAPIFLASVLTMFLLTAVFDVIGILGGYFVSHNLLGVAEGAYFGGITDFVEFADIRKGAVKSLVFGWLMAWIACFKGYHTSYGAEGVGRASTETVVTTSVLILVSDYIMTSMMFD